MPETHDDVMPLETITSPEVGEAIAADVPLILPVGAIEQHGPHLPLGTDGFIRTSSPSGSRPAGVLSSLPR